MSGAGGSGKVDPTPAPSVIEGLGVDPTYIEYARQLLSPLVAEGCFDKFLNLDVSDTECVKYTLSKGLGVGIIAGSMLVKVPQIIKILRAKSAAGITFLSVIMELFAITSNLAYSYINGFPFSAWGEACFLAIQTAVVAMLVLHYNYGSVLLALSFMVGYGASIYGLVSGLTPVETLWSMQAANVPVIVISKLIQAYSNFRNKSTGQLSAVTVFMLFGGSAARIFTSIQETGDQVIIITYAAATTVNALIAFQMLWYWNSSGKKKPAVKASGKGGKGKGGKSNGPNASSPKKGSPKKKKN